MAFCPKKIPIFNGPNCGFCCTKIEDLNVIRGKTEIIRDVNMHIYCGELTALIGPNGAGKSTLLKAIIGEIPSQGNVLFLNSEGKRKTRPLVGYVPQRWNFDPGSPVSVSDLFAATQSRLPVWLVGTTRVRRRIIDVLSRVHGEHLIDKSLGNLSGGEMQRILLALAMDPVPDLLLLDEPVSGIDINGKQLFYQIVSELRKKYHLSIILVSHDIELMGQFADRIVFLNKTVQCIGTPEEVLNDPKVVGTFGSLKENGVYEIS